MIELFRPLEANGFTSYIASGDDRDFMRPITGTASTDEGVCEPDRRECLRYGRKTGEGRSMADVPRTTTTGDDRKDRRARGDGAVDVPGDALHHREDAQLSANARGFLYAWRERLERRARR